MKARNICILMTALWWMSAYNKAGHWISRTDAARESVLFSS